LDNPRLLAPAPEPDAESREVVIKDTDFGLPRLQLNPCYIVLVEPHDVTLPAGSIWETTAPSLGIA
jgi:hypothetical protein